MPGSHFDPTAWTVISLHDGSTLESLMIEWLHARSSLGYATVNAQILRGRLRSGENYLLAQRTLFARQRCTTSPREHSTMSTFANRPFAAAPCILALAIAATACGADVTSSKPPVTVPVPGSVSAVATTNNQSGTVGQPLAAAVTVRVVDQFNAPLPGAHVQWEPVSGAGTVDASTSAADATGQASTHWTVGTTPGTDSLRVTTTNGLSIYVTANVVAGAPTIVNKTSGDAQTVPIGSSTFPLVATVTDKYGNIIAGTSVRWSASAGTLTSSSSTTDGKGQAQVVLTTVGPTAATYTVTATAGTASATFTITTR